MLPAPRYSLPFKTTPPPMPVPIVMPIMSATPRPAPYIYSPSAIAFASFSSFTSKDGSPSASCISAASGTLRQGVPSGLYRFGENRSMVRVGSISPGQPTPTPAISKSPRARFTITAICSATPRGPERASVSSEPFCAVSPVSETTPHLTRVPPMSMLTACFTLRLPL